LIRVGSSAAPASQTLPGKADMDVARGPDAAGFFYFFLPSWLSLDTPKARSRLLKKRLAFSSHLPFTRNAGVTLIP
jgi:hypothetical protein